MGIAVGDERGGEGAGRGVVGKVLRLAVPGDGDSLPGKHAVHIIGDGGGQRQAVSTEGDGGDRTVHDAVVGGHDLVQIDGAGPGGVGILHDDGAEAVVIGDALAGADPEALDGEGVALGGDGDLLPAGEVQGGDGPGKTVSEAVAVYQLQLVAGTVAIDPHGQAGVDLVVDRRRLIGIPCRRVAVAEIQRVVQPAGGAAVLHGVGGGGPAEGEAAGVTAVKNGPGGLKVLHHVQRQLGHGDGDGGPLPAGGDRDGAGAGGGGGKAAVSGDGADAAFHRPAEGLLVRRQGQVLVSGGGPQLYGGAGGCGEGGEDGAVAAPDGDIIGGLDDVDHGGAGFAPAVGGDGDVTVVVRRQQDVSVQLAVVGLQGEPLVLHGDEVGVHGGGGDVHLAARQDILAVGLHVEVAELAGGLAVRHQEDLVADGAFAAAGGGVDGLGSGVIRLRHGEGGGAAAVQAQRRLAAQLHEPLGHLLQRGADGVAGFPAVDGVKHQRAVPLLSHGGAGVGAAGQTGHHGAVLHQGVQGAQGAAHLVPPRIGGLRCHGDGGAHRQVPQGVDIVAVGLEIHGQYHLVRGDGGGGGGLHHLLHSEGQLSANGQLPVLHGADHVHAGLRVAGGVLGIEVVGI